MKSYKKIMVVLIIAFAAVGCKKTFLEAKPDKSLVVPNSLIELQALLDNDSYMNGSNDFGPDPHVGALGSDDYYITDEDFLNTDDYHRSAYIWATVIPFQPNTKNWVAPYRVIFYANTVLDALNKINPDQESKLSYNSIKGAALFFRAYQFYNLAQIFSPQYVNSSASEKLGIPLRLKADISDLTTRSTLKETYDRIVQDLMEATALLPELSNVKNRPDKASAYALLSRTFLTMQDFRSALLYANLSLALNNKLIDYNTIDEDDPQPFQLFNMEVLFNSTISYDFPSLIPTFAKIDSNLYKSYRPDDLRKNRFFYKEGSFIIFKGSYRGNSIPFTGLATDEVYLTQAECYARLGNFEQAVNSLNTLMKYRIDKSSFHPFEFQNPEDILKQVLEERRKELVMRNMRWTDLRRLNLDSRFSTTLVRSIAGNRYELPPNDLRYTLPIPEEIIGLTKIQQNIR